MKTFLKVGLAAVALLASIGAFAVRAGNNTPTLYAVTDLGPDTAANNASNPDGSGRFLVVGSTPDPDVGRRATVWTVNSDGSVDSVFKYDTSLGFSQAIDVNDHDMVIGNAFLGGGVGFVGWVDVPGVGVKFLPGIAGGVGEPLALNNQGVLVGQVPDSSGPDGLTGAVWYVDATGAITGPVLTTIGPGVTFMPIDINDEGTMCGFIRTAGGSTSPAAIADFDRNGELSITDLGFVHGSDNAASGVSINSDGLVAGYSGSGKNISVFLWDPSQPNKLTALGTLGGENPFVFAINDNVQVVFPSFNKANVTVGVIWQNGKLTDLNSVLTAPLNDTIVHVNGINNTGHIVGVTQSFHAVVLTPQ